MDKMIPRFSGPPGQEDMPYLLTPGPLTTSRTVKAAMLAELGLQVHLCGNVELE